MFKTAPKVSLVFFYFKGIAVGWDVFTADCRSQAELTAPHPADVPNRQERPSGRWEGGREMKLRRPDCRATGGLLSLPNPFGCDSCTHVLGADRKHPDSQAWFYSLLFSFSSFRDLDLFRVEPCHSTSVYVQNQLCAQPARFIIASVPRLLPQLLKHWPLVSEQSERRDSWEHSAVV